MVPIQLKNFPVGTAISRQEREERKKHAPVATCVPHTATARGIDKVRIDHVV